MHSHLTPPPTPTHYSWGPGYPVTNYRPASHRLWVCPGAPQSVGLIAVPCILGLGSLLKATSGEWSLFWTERCKGLQETGVKIRVDYLFWRSNSLLFLSFHYQTHSASELIIGMKLKFNWLCSIDENIIIGILFWFLTVFIKHS